MRRRNRGIFVVDTSWIQYSSGSIRANSFGPAYLDTRAKALSSEFPIKMILCLHLPKVTFGQQCSFRICILCELEVWSRLNAQVDRLLEKELQDAMASYRSTRCPEVALQKILNNQNLTIYNLGESVADLVATYTTRSLKETCVVYFSFSRLPQF